MQLVDHNGRSISLGRELGRGGEGAVFEIAGSSDLVAKLYHPTSMPDAEKAQKLFFMARMATSQLSKLAAWPVSVLSQRANGRLCGIVMPRLKESQEVHVLYSPVHRRAKFPHADWHFLVRAARNCAAAFATLHEAGVVIGDVNQGNVFVDRQAMVRLIDCDSFQLNSNGKVFRCMVGVAHFTPPELQNARFEQISRTLNHDSFGLAVLIFHLLFLGRHPFAGRFLGKGEMPTIEQAISEYRFAFGNRAAQMQVLPPPHSPTMAILPRELALLFERSFERGSEISGRRPSATEWANALENLESTIRKCNADPGHVFASNSANCPWCALSANGSPNFFISVTVERLRNAPKTDITAIWVRIEAVPRPGLGINRAPAPALGSIQPRPAPAFADDRELLIRALGITAGGAAIIALILLLFHATTLGLLLFLLAGGLVGAWLPLYWKSPVRRERAERSGVLRDAQRELRRVTDAMASRIHLHSQNFDRLRQSLEIARHELGTLDQQLGAEVHNLERNAHNRQFAAYLEQFNIEDANIPGIGANRVAILSFHGIETASDLTDVSIVLGVPGFGPVLAERIMEWKYEIGRRFRFDPTKALPPSDLQALQLKYQQKRIQLEQSLQNGASQLQRIWAACKEEVESLDKRAVILEFAVEQARADYAAV